MANCKLGWLIHQNHEYSMKIEVVHIAMCSASGR